MEFVNNYKYKLQYFCDGATVTHEFPADVYTEELMWKLRDFLCGCSWTEEALKDILKLEEE
jgi:hypothetical protein|nr:MAG TPA: hypothetical protein [Caudoviricetes sp.]